MVLKFEDIIFQNSVDNLRKHKKMLLVWGAVPPNNSGTDQFCGEDKAYQLQNLQAEGWIKRKYDQYNILYA